MGDSTALSTQANAGALSESRSHDVLSGLIAASQNPEIDAGKIETMARLGIDLQDREIQAQFNQDLNAALFEMPIITRGGIITIPAKGDQPARSQGRYAKFEDIDRVVRPILQRNNLAIRFDVSEKDQQITVQPILSHKNGHTERGGAMRLPLDTSGAKNNVQGAGSAVSYGKRYTMCAMLNIITEGTDDDGSLGRGVVTMPYERSNAVLEDAEREASAGTYNEWYRAQGVKDRGWLVAEGHHARLGGDPPPKALEGGKNSDTLSAEKWLAGYKSECAGAPDLEALTRIQTGAAKALEKLRNQFPDLSLHAIEAGQAAHKRLITPPDQTNTLFGES